MLAVLGLVLSVTQFRRTRPVRLSAAIPYSGWMRWHYITGAVFGVFTFTFAFSGLLSMEPFAWTNARGIEVPRAALTGGAVDLAEFGRFDLPSWDRLLGGQLLKEIEFVRIADVHYYVARHTSPAADYKRERLHQPYPVNGRAEDGRMLVAAGTLAIRHEPFSVESLLARLKVAVPDAPVVESTLMSDYDSYYYSRQRLTPLPVLRVKFADPAETWVYIDPSIGQVLAQIPRLARVERWLYNGLHSLDFSFWYSSRAWDVGMILLSLGGLTTSVLGLVLGIRRMRRVGRRWRTAGERAAGGAESAHPVTAAVGTSFRER